MSASPGRHEGEAVLTSGRPWPLGATSDEHGVNFAVHAQHATAIEACLFDDDGSAAGTWRLPRRTGDVWHGHLRGLQPGQLYGLRAHGPWRPDRGHRYNAAKLLLDPYARDIVGEFAWHPEHFGAHAEHPQHPDSRDNAARALKARVVSDPPFDWNGDRHPAIALADSVIYELHVKTYSRLHPDISPALRGTYAGLAHPASLEHLQRLGITAVSLLPVHYRLSEQRLCAMGLSNHWGYNTLGFFCPDPRLAASAAEGGAAVRAEFKAMVRDLHCAGIEVLLDVVYNHTAESDDLGPTLSFRGLDNAGYYRLNEQSPAHYQNDTGCGNMLDIRQPQVLRLVMDSLRHWVDEYHVDGFRFDLAPVLGRTTRGFDRHAPFFTAVAQDPALSRVKMIAEPWDIGPGGYQVGGFPNGWLEWNDQFRDTMRCFWLQGPSGRGAMAQRLCGSSDLYQARYRAPVESVNYIGSHDGFTLRDLLTYGERRNHANGEDNRDGHGHNLGHNCGAEGPSDDPAVTRLRARLQRALLATTLLSQGTPMLAAGDELGHTQLGNNNPYCQDNETTWIDWSAADRDLLAYTRRLVALRHAALPYANAWYSGLADAKGLDDIAWLCGDGRPLQDAAWNEVGVRSLGCLIGKPGKARAPLLLLFNADPVDRRFLLPAGVWKALLDSTHPRGASRWHGQGESLFPLPAHSVVLLAAAGAGVG